VTDKAEMTGSGDPQSNGEVRVEESLNQEAARANAEN